MRDMVFISHANPEDNEFTLWLALQLAREGYPVWCDLAKLLGGEVFWNDIQQAIRDRTIKFLFVLSRSSNAKQAPKDELEVALKVQRSENLLDFVIPIWIDDLPSRDFYVRLTNINAIPFNRSWAEGLAQLLAKLEKDRTPRRADFSPGAVASWWREHYSASAGISPEPETLISNWYPIDPAPIYFHTLESRSGRITLPDSFPYPSTHYKDFLVSFAPAADFADKLGDNVFISSTDERPINTPNPAPRLWSFKEERKAVTRILRECWAGMLSRRALPTYLFANSAVAFYFRKATIQNDRVHCIGHDGKPHWRRIMGTKGLKNRSGDVTGLRYWHFSLEAKPTSWPLVCFCMKAHVLFSDDGSTIWDNKRSMHTARRSQCRQWWNDRWRDLISGTVTFLANGADSISLQVGSSATVNVRTVPISVNAPVSFKEEEVSLSVEDDDSEEIIGEELEDFEDFGSDDGEEDLEDAPPERE